MFGTSLSTAAPGTSSHYEMKPTMIMSIWCTCYAISIILFRCTGRWLRTERVWVEDVIISLSILVLVARTTLVTFVLRYGTNNVDAESLLGEGDVKIREMGSKLVLGSRALYYTYLWMIKLSVGIYIARLTNQFWAAKSLTSKTSGGRVIKTFLSRHLNELFYAFLGLSYIAIVISGATSCRPFYHYWQVSPTASPECRVAYGALLTMGVFNILTDLALVALPLPMIMVAKLPPKLKAETLLLMLFPLVNVAFTCYRLPTVAADGGSQRYRTLTASIDILVSTASANALVVISFLQDRGFKKLRYHYQDGEDGPVQQDLDDADLELKAMENVSPLAILRAPSSGRGMPLSPLHPRPTWGSDEDLMRDESDSGPTADSTHTASTSLAEGEVEGADALGGVGTEGMSLTTTNHLSPHQKVETSIVAARHVGFADEEDGARQSSRTQPSRASISTSRGIIVETSWKVQIS